MATKTSKGTSSVKDWVAALDSEKRAIVEAIRRVVRDAVPALDEDIKWGRPVFSLDAKNIAYLTAAKAHITFGYFEGSELDDPNGLLEGSGKQMRSIKVRSAADVPSRALKAWTKQAVAQAKAA